MNRTRRVAVLFACALCLILFGFIALLSFDRSQVGPHDPQTQDAYVGGDATPLSARVPGYVRSLPIADNQPVHAGDLIAQIEQDDYAARLARAQADVSAASAKLASLDAQLQQITEQLAQSASEATAAVASTLGTSPELLRQQRLIHTDLGLQRTLDRARADQQRAAAGVQAARAAVEVRARQADALAAQRAEQAASLRASQAALRLAEVELDWTRITAPVSGTLGVRRVREGDLLAAGSTVVTLTPLDSVWVDGNFTERQITDIRIGQRARLVLDAFPDQPLDGHVVGLSPVTGSVLSAIPSDNATGNFTKVAQRVPVRIAIDWNASPLLGRVRPGMSVVAKVLTGARP